MSDDVETTGAVEAEHQHLSALLEQLGITLCEAFDRVRCEELTKRLDESMEAHFAREESLYYPTLWTLRPQAEEPLRQLIARHDEFRTSMADLLDRIRSRDAEEARESLESFTANFAEHEAAEEKILDSLREGNEALPD